MIEELKILLDTVKDVPDMALWSIAGFGAYKIIIYLSSAGAILKGLKWVIDALSKAHTEKMSQTKKIITNFDLRRTTISCDDTDSLFLELIEKMKRLTVVDGKSEYIHREAVLTTIKALDEHIQREAKKEEM